MFCIQCGKELPDGARFCPWCGVAVREQETDFPLQPEETAVLTGDPTREMPPECGDCCETEPIPEEYRQSGEIDAEILKKAPAARYCSIPSEEETEENIRMDQTIAETTETEEKPDQAVLYNEPKKPSRARRIWSWIELICGVLLIAFQAVNILLALRIWGSIIPPAFSGIFFRFPAVFLLGYFSHTITGLLLIASALLLRGRSKATLILAIILSIVVLFIIICWIFSAAAALGWGLARNGSLRIYSNVYPAGNGHGSSL